MNPPPPMAQAAPRVLKVLALAPMTRQQMETHLMLSRRTVLTVLRDLMQRNIVERTELCTPANGAWPACYALIGNSTITGESS